MTDTDVQILSTVEALARLGKERDPEAWAALIERHGAAILRAAGRVTGDAALQEDICQETLLQIRAHAGQFRAHGNSGEAEQFAKGWIMRIACCTALKMVRTRSRAASRETERAVNAMPTTPAEMVLAKEEAEQVRREVAALPDDHRDAVSLRFFGELAYVEIAATLKISEEAAKKRVQRGLVLLRSRLATCGIALSLALLANVLQRGAVSAAETAAGGGMALETLDLSRRAAWQALVNSSQAPALSGVVLGGGVTMLAKAGLGIAAAALLALGAGGGMELRSSRMLAEQAVASANETAAHSRALETKLEGSRAEMDALRRVVESRNSELTSLRDKVAEMDKKTMNGGFTASGFTAGGVPNGNQVFFRQIGQPGQSIKGPDGKEIALPNVAMIANAAGFQQDGKGNGEIQFPGGKMVIEMNADAATGAQQNHIRLDVKNTPNVSPGNPQIPPAVLPPAPPAPQAKDDKKVDGNF